MTEVELLRINDVPRQRFVDIPHPTNRVWPGTPDTVALTIEEEFWLGHRTGLLWPDAWQHVPGGPFVHREYQERLIGGFPRFYALTQYSKALHDAYMQGWHSGFQLQYVQRYGSLPSWYKSHHTFW